MQVLFWFRSRSSVERRHSVIHSVFHNSLVSTILTMFLERMQGFFGNFHSSISLTNYVREID